MSPQSEAGTDASELDAKLRALYHQSFVKDGEALRQAIIQGQAEEAVYYAHRIKGAAQMAQADGVAALADRLERCARGGVAPAVPDMSAMADALREEVARWFTNAR